ncbi:MAG: efflux transporter outer membrane subunit [Betaproteobacteria bacterium]|nr:efflux transporter outer membrane subunit [Betaproteobacteria bacterium]
MSAPFFYFIRTRILLTLAVPVLMLAACAVGPDYRRPEIDVPGAWKEDPPPGWKAAQPQDMDERGEWWKVYNEPQLDDLVAQVEISNQNVAAAVARYRQAVALLGASSAAAFPTANLGASAGRSGSGGNESIGTNGITHSGINNGSQISLNLGWEVDIWGRIRRDIEAGKARVQASDADYSGALLSAQATLVQSYLQWRVNAVQRRLLDETADAYRKSLQVIQNRYTAGVAQRSDVTQAQSQLSNTLAQAINLDLQRTQLEHAMALLIGVPPARLKLVLAKPDLPRLPKIPTALPSELLERRPDIASAERLAAAANANIGVAQSAFYPTLTLSATGGYQQGSGFGPLFVLPNRFWSLGSALAAFLFDGGLRSAQLEQARGAYDEAVANYRQTVLIAFQEVEDNLAALRVLEEESVHQREAARSAAESEALVRNQYLAGTASFLEVFVAQASALSARSLDIGVEGQRLIASATLLKALGGGWYREVLEKPPGTEAGNGDTVKE